MADEKGQDKDLSIEEITSDELEEVPGGNGSCNTALCAPCAMPEPTVQPVRNQT